MGEIIQGDCLSEMHDLEPESVDSIVTDPPYGLNFMGKDWDKFKKGENPAGGNTGRDTPYARNRVAPSFHHYGDSEMHQYQKFCYEWGKEALRVLKPGGYLLAFSGTRTYHRMVCGLEDAGFEIKDQIDWLYGSGFPKSTDISKQIDKKFLREYLTEKLGHKPTRSQFKQAWEHEKEVVDSYEESSGWKAQDRKNAEQSYRPNRYYDDEPDTIEKIAGITSEAEQWDGFGTALKPAHEPIVLAQKPRSGTYAENVLEHNVGGLNIDRCKIGVEPHSVHGKEAGKFELGHGKAMKNYKEVKGRWPANIILDPKSSRLLDEQSGERKSGFMEAGQSYKSMDDSPVYGNGAGKTRQDTYGDSGGASRFFYSAKAHKSERNAGLEDLENVKMGQSGGARQKLKEGKDEYQTGEDVSVGLNVIKEVKNDIATLKPINLMRYLVRLVTPPDGTVLDLFAGSGTTGCACEIEGFDYILIEKRERFAEVIAPKRIEYWSKEKNWSELKGHEELEDPIKREISNLEAFCE